MTDQPTPYHPGLHAAEHPDRPAVITGSGHVVTFAELEAASCRLAQALRVHGLEAGDHVALVLPNDHRTHEVAWAAQRSGLYYTLVNTHLAPEEAAYIVNDCGAKVLITSSRLADLAAALIELTPDVGLRLMVTMDGNATTEGYQDYDSFVAGHPSTPLESETEGSPMLYSSGTTGRPKGIRRDLTGHPFGADATLAPMLTHLMGYRDGDVYLSPAPLYHSAPLVWSMTVQRLGGTVVVMERFDPEQCLQLIEQYGVTHGQFVPTMFVRMLKLPDATRAAYDLSSVKSIVHAAAPCAPEVKRRMIDWWGPVVNEYYSGTEGGGMTWATATEALERPGTVGRALFGVIHICADDGSEAVTGEDGVVWFDSGQLARFEYNNDPEKTRQTFNEHGWSTLWDVGHLDADGFLYLTDRKLFMIVSGGVNIYPQEIEDVLVLHPAVADVAVFGVPEPEMGEEVKAVVQPAPGVMASPELAEEIMVFCRERLSHYKCPRSVDFTEALPRGENGKLYKKALRDTYWTSATG
jgi:acyl-CoA synthetase (AMP-forming)/AMP-acid ligase II